MEQLKQKTPLMHGKYRRLMVFLISLLTSFLLLICPGFLRFIDFRFDFLVSSFTYFFAVLFLLKKYPDCKKEVILGFLILLIGFVSVLDIRSKKIILGTLYTVEYAFASFLAYIYNKTRILIIKIFVVSFLTCLCIFYFFWGITYYNNYFNYGSITGITNIELPQNWNEYIKEPKDNKYNEIDGKLRLFDFYNNFCAICFTEFPKFQALYEKYRNNESISVSAVNIPTIWDTIPNPIDIIRDEKYTFPVVLGNKGLDTLFGVTTYPTVIIERNNIIIYKGDIEHVGDVIEKLLHKR